MKTYSRVRATRSMVKNRRITSSIYSMSNVSKSEKYFDSCSNHLTEWLGQFAGSEKPCDLGEWLHW